MEREVKKEKNTPIWSKLSSSMSYYLRSCDMTLSDEEILEDYLYIAFGESEIDGNLIYLNKQTREWVEIDKYLQERIKDTFIERLEKKRVKENKQYVAVEELECEDVEKPYKNNVIEFKNI
ncbi:MAG: hypothetical protein E6682_15265 [Clostridium perfringens]|uniref:hypothetical protein n=2 Tax=Clostridium perfringens TaxID=1502 RepID=UPI001A9BD823|nr:hypothetical protein [Clostridium perfringens]MDH5085110.1 hypothetical protein [Clostridium perfringens]MDH5090762.1 hypothetical protein [Clostridium perfringens]MDU0868394.1 hypothetical protein [Clostridium perfringens]MDU2471098.1 hypothetical protein [Clostridium perfringens]MDU3196505.1 hypothetical protein [Clostridium perfringens]